MWLIIALLALVLWFVLDNILVAIILAVFAVMLYSIIQAQRHLRTETLHTNTASSNVRAHTERQTILPHESATPVSTPTQVCDVQVDQRGETGWVDDSYIRWLESEDSSLTDVKKPL